MIVPRTVLDNSISERIQEVGDVIWVIEHLTSIYKALESRPSMV